MPLISAINVNNTKWLFQYYLRCISGAPGALHHARFVAFCLHIMKIAMLADVLPPGLLTPVMLGNIDRMAQFISLFYGPWFLQDQIARFAVVGTHVYIPGVYFEMKTFC